MSITDFQTLQLSSAPDRQLALRLFSHPSATAQVILAGAMGVPQYHYEKVARFLNQQGLTVITFDYYGMGASLDRPLRQCRTNMIEWGQLDAEAVIRFAKQQHPELPLNWIGHSVGGQLLGMIPGVNQLDQIITMASGNGYWRRNAPPTRYKAWLLWHLIAPTLVPLAGCFPGRRLGMVGDLPGPVMQQWRRWCLNPDYAVGVEGAAMRAGYAQVRVPIQALAFTDDEMMSRHNVESLHAFYSQAPVELTFLSPAALGEQRVGHLGWFREGYRESIWQQQLLPRLKTSRGQQDVQA